MALENPAWELSAQRLKEALAELLFSWNSLEAATRFLLETAAGVRSFEGQILTADIKNVALTHALKAITETWEPELRAHVLHYLKGYDRLRDWRNYFVHGPIAVAREEDRVGMYVSEIGVTGGRLKQHQRLVGTEEVEEIVAAVLRFHAYLSRIIAEVYDRGPTPGLFAVSGLSTTAPPDLPAERSRDHIYPASSYSPPPHLSGPEG